MSGPSALPPEDVTNLRPSAMPGTGRRNCGLERGDVDPDKAPGLISASFCMRNLREAMTSLGLETQAPICDLRGREAK